MLIQLILMDTTQFIKGLHHVTATVDDAQEDFDFYTKLLGFRLVKKTVNFDNNQVYHFYYGNEAGQPGTIMTTFPYKGHNIRDGIIGTGQVKITGFSTPKTAIDFWKTRLKEAGITTEESTKFGNPTLSFKDPSGLILEIIGNDHDDRDPWTTDEVNKEVALRGIYNVTLSIAEVKSTFDFLEKEFSAKKVGTEGKITRYEVGDGAAGGIVDVLDDADAVKGLNGIGTVHHVAWRIENEDNLKELRRHLVDDLGFKVTEVKDRNYFRSIYFRMPGHVLFEVATIPPGFDVDESLEELGQALKLPEWEEPNRAQIESILPKLS